MAGLCEIIERRVAEAYERQPHDRYVCGPKQIAMRQRQVAMYFMGMHTPMSLEQIGHYFGSDDAAAWRAVQRVETLMAEDADFSRKIESIRQTLAEKRA